MYMDFGEWLRCERSDEVSFETFTPKWFNIDENKKENIEVLNFTILWIAMVEMPPSSMRALFEVNLLFIFRGDVVWKEFSHMARC